MLVLDNGDKIRGDASAATVVDYSLHGLDDGVLKQLADGQLAVATGDLYTADSVDVVSTLVLVNTDTSARTVNLYLLPSGGTARRLIPKDLSLGIGYSLHFDGAKISVMDTSGNIITSFSNLISDTAYGAGWNGVTTIAPSKNAIYDEVEFRTKAAAVITDHRLVRGDGGSRGVQESTIIVDDSGRMINSSQPCFQVQPTNNQNSIATGSWVTIILDAEAFDVGNNFASNVFTAPITGKYQLNAVVRIQNLDTACTNYGIGIITSNRNYEHYITPLFTADVYAYPFVVTIIVDMDVNDTATLKFYQADGTVQTDIKTSTIFSGILIC